MKILKERCEKNLQRVQKKCKRLHSLYLDLHFFPIIDAFYLVERIP